MNAAADPGRRVVQLAGLALRERDQFGDRFRLDVRIDQHDQRAGGDQADRREILARVVADIGVERRIDRERAGAAEAERVAVGRGFRDLARRDRAARPALVLDHDLLAERLAHLLGDDARHHVVAAAGRIRHHQRDRARGIVLRRDTRGHERDAESSRNVHRQSAHSLTRASAQNETAGLFREPAANLKIRDATPRPRRGADNRRRLAELVYARGLVVLQAGDLVLHMQLATFQFRDR